MSVKIEDKQNGENTSELMDSISLSETNHHPNHHFESESRRDDNKIKINSLFPIEKENCSNKQNCKNIVKNMLRSRSKNESSLKSNSYKEGSPLSYFSQKHDSHLKNSNENHTLDNSTYNSEENSDQKSDTEIMTHSPESMKTEMERLHKEHIIEIEKRHYDLENYVDPSLWTDETVEQLIQFSDICNESAIQCKRASIFHKKMSTFLQLSTIILGTVTATTSIGTIPVEIKTIISTVCGGLTALASSVQGYLKYSEKSEIEANSCFELQRIARGIRIELSKSKQFRVDPYKYIIQLENQREKILKRVGIEED